MSVFGRRQKEREKRHKAAARPSGRCECRIGASVLAHAYASDGRPRPGREKGESAQGGRAGATRMAGVSLSPPIAHLPRKRRPFRARARRPRGRVDLHGEFKELRRRLPSGSARPGLARAGRCAGRKLRVSSSSLPAFRPSRGIGRFFTTFFYVFRARAQKGRAN